MDVVMVFVALTAALFGIAFMTRRRFGALGLALAAGAVLSNLWATELTPFVAGAGLSVSMPSLPSLVSAAITLLPATIMLFRGPTYSNGVSRIIGALAFAALSLALLLDPLEGALILQGFGREAYDFFVEHRALIVTVGLIFAVVDLLGLKMPRGKKGRH